MEELMEVLAKSNIPFHKVWATKKTGRILTDENAKHLTQEDLEEWDDATQEGRELEETHSKEELKQLLLS